MVGSNINIRGEKLYYIDICFCCFQFQCYFLGFFIGVVFVDVVVVCYMVFLCFVGYDCYYFQCMYVFIGVFFVNYVCIGIIYEFCLWVNFVGISYDFIKVVFNGIMNYDQYFILKSVGWCFI